MFHLKRAQKTTPRYLRLIRVLFVLGLIVLVPSLAFAASVTKSNGADGPADGSEITRKIEITSDDFASGSSVSTITMTVQFAKIDAPDESTCFTSGHQGGDPINREIYMSLTSPMSTTVDLINKAPNFTYTDNSAYGGQVTVVFDDTAATQVGGPAPTSGTFRPEEALSAFNGEDPIGTWTLTVGDSLQSAPVCFYDFSLTVTAEQKPTVADQTFSVLEDSSNSTVVDTIVANDADPDDKLSFAVTGGTGQDVFDVGVLTGEITVKDATQLTTTPGSFTLNVTVTDSAALTDTAVITINVTPQNDAPVITESPPITVNMSEDSSPTPFSLTLNATDEENDPLTWSISSQASNGTASTTSGDGNSNVIGYTPNLNYNGSDSFVVQVSDDNNGTDTITVNVTIAAQNDDPNAVDDGYTVDENSTNNTLTVLTNDTNPDSGETLTITAVVSPTTQGGTATTNGSSISYTPKADSLVTDTFTYTISDGTGRTDTATVTITVKDVNEDPVITEGDSTAVVMDEDSSPTAFALTLNATDGDVGNTLTWSIQTQGNSGTASASGTGASKVIVYTPTANVNGSDSFVVRVSDGNGGTDDITVNVTIHEQNDDPDAVDDSPSVNEQSSNNTLYPLTNDSISPDMDETLTITAVGPTNNGGTVVTTTTSLTYTPDATFIGTDVFTYTISDGRGGTDTATISVSVDNVNFSPAITEGVSTSVTMDEDGSPTPFSLTLNATDPDADSITWSVQSQAGHGTASTSGTGTSKSISYTPNSNYNGSDSFIVRVTDGNGGQDSITVNVTIDSINDAPNAVDDTKATSPDTAVTINVLDNDTDAENNSLTITAVTQGSKGAVSHNGTTVTYTPDPGEIDNDTFTYTISDGNGGSDTGTVTVQLGLYETFMPMIVNNFVLAPDLVVTNISASSTFVEVVIENQGAQATSSGFWVDFYIAPDPVPSHENELWPDLSTEGVVWGVNVSIPAGDSLTLSYSTAPGAPNLYYSASNSNFSGNLAVGTSVYAQVDSAHLNTTYGGVLETHEILGEAYNNVSAEFTAVNSVPASRIAAKFISNEQLLTLPLR